MIAKHPGECKPHPDQDTRYGPGFRLMTEGKGPGGAPIYRCTVCGGPGKKVKMNKRPGWTQDQLTIRR